MTEWLDPAGVMRYLNLRHRSAVNRLVKDGKLPPPSYHLGPRSPRFDRDGIDAVMRGRQAADSMDAALERALAAIRASGKRRSWRNAGQGAPAPGSSHAVIAGCTCPIHANRNGRGRPTPVDGHGYSYDEACPLHGERHV